VQCAAPPKTRGPTGPPCSWDFDSKIHGQERSQQNLKFFADAVLTDLAQAKLGHGVALSFQVRLRCECWYAV